MTGNFIGDLRALVDHLAARGVRQARLVQGDELLDITLRAGPAVAAPAAAPLLAPGPGIFHHRHPATGADLPCLAAGDFLFPLAAGAGFLAADGALVGYGTPLMTQG